MCKLCEEDEKNKIKNDVYLYKKIIAKMAYKNINAVVDWYQFEGIEIGFCWDGCIRVDDTIFTERDLK